MAKPVTLIRNVRSLVRYVPLAAGQWQVENNYGCGLQAPEDWVAVRGVLTTREVAQRVVSLQRQGGLENVQLLDFDPESEFGSCYRVETARGDFHWNPNWFWNWEVFLEPRGSRHGMRMLSHRVVYDRLADDALPEDAIILYSRFPSTTLVWESFYHSSRVPLHLAGPPPLPVIAEYIGGGCASIIRRYLPFELSLRALSNIVKKFKGMMYITGTHRVTFDFKDEKVLRAKIW